MPLLRTKIFLLLTAILITVPMIVGAQKSAEKKSKTGKIELWLASPTKGLPILIANKALTVERLEIFLGKKGIPLALLKKEIFLKQLRNNGVLLHLSDVIVGKYEGVRIVLSGGEKKELIFKEPILITPNEMTVVTLSLELTKLLNPLKASPLFKSMLKGRVEKPIRSALQSYQNALAVIEKSLPKKQSMKIKELLATKGNIAFSLKKALQAQNKGAISEALSELAKSLSLLKKAITVVGSAPCSREAHIHHGHGKHHDDSLGCYDDKALSALFPLIGDISSATTSLCPLASTHFACAQGGDLCPDCEKLAWDETPFGIGNSATAVEPALLVANNQAYLAVVGTSGQIYVTERSVQESVGYSEGDSCWSMTQDWGDWLPSENIPPYTRFNPTTPPVFVQRLRNNQIYIFARGDDNNLYFSRRIAAGSWSAWEALTDDESVVGRLDAAATAVQPGNWPDEIHVAYHSGLLGFARLIMRAGSSDNVDRYDHLFPATADSGFTPSIASDNANRVVLAAAFPGLSGTGQLRFAEFSRDAGNFGTIDLHPVEAISPSIEGITWTGKSDLIYTKNGDFHAVFGAESPFGSFYVHYALRGEEVVNYTEDWGTLSFVGNIPPTLADYRNKLILAEVTGGGTPLFFRWDATDRQQPRWASSMFSPWILEEPKDEIKTNFRVAMDDDGKELYAALASEGGPIRFVLLSRSLALKRLLQQKMILNFADDDEDGTYDAGCFTKPVWEVPLATDIGFGTWTTPEWMTSHLMPDYVEAGLDAGTELFEEMGGYPVWIHSAANLRNAYFGGGIHVDAGMNYYNFLEEFYHKYAHALAISREDGCPSDAYTCAYGQYLEPRIPESVIESARELFSQRSGCCLGDDDRAPGFIGVSGGDYENYDSFGDEHAWLYVLLYYFYNPELMRDLMELDADNGDTLLRDKYNWVKTWIYRYVEFDDENLVRPE